MTKTKISLIFFGPKEDGDILENKLVEELKVSVKNVEFIDGVIISDFKELEKIAKRNDIDGIFLCFFKNISGKIPWFFEEEKVNISLLKKHPIVFTAFESPISGETRFLEFYDLVKKEKIPALPVFPFNLTKIKKVLHLIEVIHQLKESKILNVGKSNDVWDHSYFWRWKIEEYFKKLKEIFGLNIITVNSEEVNEYYKNIDEKLAVELADKWMGKAISVESNKEEIIKSAKLYFALKKAMEKVGANAVTADCISLFGRLGTAKETLPCYPCLAFAQLNDEGFTGTCEADMDAVVTQLVMRYLIGRPGFICDQTFDVLANRMIYWHCVCPTKLFGKDDVQMPYKIRPTHTGKGAGLEVKIPSGENITVLKFSVREKKIAIHCGRCLGNALRPGNPHLTQWFAEADAEKILENYNHQMFGRHRVVYIGDFKDEIYNLAKLLGLTVVEEDK